MNNELYLILLLLICLYIAVIDYFSRIINNRVLLFLAMFQVFLSPNELHFNSFFFVLGLGVLLYTVVFVGAGDIKYAAVLSLSIPFSELSWAYILTALSGGVLAMSYLLCRCLMMNRKTFLDGIPYGVAISVGFYLVILTQFTSYV